MTHVDFYLLSDESRSERLRFVCRLVEKIHNVGQGIYIHCSSEAEQNSLDDQLWTFKANAFVAHQIVTTNAYKNTDTSIWLGMNFEPDGKEPILINLGIEIPPFFSRFERVLEVINQEQELRQQGREKYRFYQQRGYLLRHHQL
ncbi:MAG: DNA polymerase III subunit chi [Gammaproteobacteria bacterium]|nr:DNA polymerase III subunit chi [Gammaproteobacteria bacterium]